MSAIDPGVDEGIKESAQDVQGDKAESQKEQDEEDDFLQPSHWWFASTACPLLASTFGPMASGFNICALVHEWRQTLPPGLNVIDEQGHTLPDPGWLLAINAVSLVAALIANAALLLNMARRLKFSIAQTITITGFGLAGILLVADMAALVSLPEYGIKMSKYMSPQRHTLTQAFYYAIFSAAIYLILAVLMGITVYGALKGHYKKDFHLTSAQRTLMLQTMAFIAYLLLGALVFSSLEGWMYLDSVYWADVTLLTVGLGDLAPTTNLTRGLLFPFAIGGVLMVGLVVGSIRSLVLERGKAKLEARIVEKRRSQAIHNVDERKQTIKISAFAKADFSVDPSLSPAQRREEEFEVMRKVQRAAERERRWFSLAMSATFTFIIWLLGAYIFKVAEYEQAWTYMDSTYFAYTSLMTIGYGDFSPQSNSGRAFFVFWSLLAVPSLTILISNMGDTIIKWFSDLTIWIGSVTVLPGEGGFRASIRCAIKDFGSWAQDSLKYFTLPGLCGTLPIEHPERMPRTEYENKVLDKLAERLISHVDDSEQNQAGVYDENDTLERDIQFYHYVLARECRNLQKDLNVSPPKNYSWGEWEYFLKLMGNEDDPQDFPGQAHPDIMVPQPLRVPRYRMLTETHGNVRPESNGSEQRSGSEEKDLSSSDEPTNPQQVDGNVDRQTSRLMHANTTRQNAKKRQRRLKNNPDAEPDYLLDWSWLSNESPLMSQKSEPEWIFERLSAALERELNRTRKGYRRKPPISLRDANRRGVTTGNKDAEKSTAEGAARVKEQRELEKAARSEE